MTTLEQLQPNAAVRGVFPDCAVTVVNVQWFGSETVELTYKSPTGKVANEILYRHDEARLELVEEGRPWSFEGDGELFQFVSEAHRIHLAHLFDPVLAHLQLSNIAPVDLPQASIGPGIAVYTRDARVLESDGSPLGVRTALALINQVLGEAMAEQEGDFDADSRWALAGFEQSGFKEGDHGVAETLSTAKNTSVSELAAQLDAKAETARELAYRLYTVCERKKRAAEAIAYNALVQGWPEIIRLAGEGAGRRADQTSLFGERED